MSERTIAEIARDLEAQGAYGLRRGEPKRAGQEILRARSEEMRLTEALDEALKDSSALNAMCAEKDAQIKALADLIFALPHAQRNDGPCWCTGGQHVKDCEQRRAALRLVGRLP